MPITDKNYILVEKAYRAVHEKYKLVLQFIKQELIRMQMSCNRK
jgi:hypothetical protein